MERNPEDLATECAAYWLWLNRIRVDGMPFELKGRKYQQDIMRPYTPEGRFKHFEVIRKGAQIGITMCKVGEIAHGCINSHYPQGVIVYFPSKIAVDLFSVSRFKPFIEDNPGTIGRYMTGSDRGDFRKIGNSKVYFLGGTATSRIKDQKKDATAVRSNPADWILLDERDLFDEEIASQVDQRLGNSKVNRRTDMGTPSIPDYGVDLLYRHSTRCRWQIKCDSCGKFTCLETEFPDCIVLKDGGYFRCSNCDSRLDLDKGSWVPDYPDRDIVGYWPSQLLNPNTNLTILCKKFADPKAYGTTEGELKRTCLGEPHIDAEDELQQSDVFACCGRDNMSYGSDIQCAMGADIGKTHYAVIGYRLDRDRFKVIKVARVSDWGGLHDLAERYNVSVSVIDAQPEYHKSREFQAEERNSVYLCYYSDTQKQFIVWQPDNLVKVQRTEILDATHSLVKAPGSLILPRADGEEIKIFARQLTMTVRVQETDKRTGSVIYRYVPRGDGEDHYRHALNYFLIACKKLGVSQAAIPSVRQPRMQDMDYVMGAA